MRPIIMFLAMLMVVAAFSSASSQTGEKVGPQGHYSSQQKPTGDTEETNGARTTAGASPEEPAIWLYLVGNLKFMWLVAKQFVSRER